MSIKVGINGFGRIGRLVLRCAKAFPNIEIVGMSKNSFSSFISHLFFTHLLDFSFDL